MIANGPTAKISRRSKLTVTVLPVGRVLEFEAVRVALGQGMALRDESRDTIGAENRDFQASVSIEVYGATGKFARRP